MKPFIKLGNQKELSRAEWKRNPEKFEALVTKCMKAYPDKNRCQIETMIRKSRSEDSYAYDNDVYMAIVRPHGRDWLHLSIKRKDNGPIHDWRELQEIKNMLVGPEHEGVELYPAESRKVDTANQYHLWVLKTEDRLPIGYTDGLVVDSDPETDALAGTSQREFTHEERVGI